MAIFVVGVNHKTAKLALRERIYFALDKLSLYLQDLLASGHTKEAVLLSTCNRSELYCEADDYTKIRDWFVAQTPFTNADLKEILYQYQDKEAISHMMSVACGLDSMVLGEAQILGQMKEAFSESCAAQAVGPAFHRLFRHIFTIAKEIRTTSAIGACPVSMASAAVHFAKSKVKDFSQANIIIVGAGDTAQLLLRYLKNLLKKPVTLINRTLEKAFTMMESHQVYVCGFEELPSQLSRADILFSMTGSALPIINRGMVLKALEHRGGKPLMLIDIAVPRDIEPDVANIANVELFCIDDLKSIIETNRKGREHAAQKARELILTQSAKVIAEYQSFDHVAYTIRAYRNQIENICREEIIKAKQELLRGQDPVMVLETFAHAYTNKLLHVPSVQLRQAGVEGRFELLRYAKQLFAIPDLDMEHI